MSQGDITGWMSDAGFSLVEEHNDLFDRKIFLIFARPEKCFPALNLLFHVQCFTLWLKAGEYSHESFKEGNPLKTSFTAPDCDSLTGLVQKSVWSLWSANNFGRLHAFRFYPGNSP